MNGKQAEMGSPKHSMSSDFFFRKWITTDKAFTHSGDSLFTKAQSAGEDTPKTWDATLYSGKKSITILNRSLTHQLTFLKRFRLIPIFFLTTHLWWAQLSFKTIRSPGISSASNVKHWLTQFGNRSLLRQFRLSSVFLKDNMKTVNGLCFSKPQFPHLLNGDMVGPISVGCCENQRYLTDLVHPVQ